MVQHFSRWRGRPSWLLLSVVAWGLIAQVLLAQAPQAASNSQRELVALATENEAPLKSPGKSPGPKNLDQCLELGFQHQPSLDAARASLDAARIGASGINRMVLPRLFKPDMKIRSQQSTHGVTIAEASVTQAEWETRYAITRTFFTVQYVRSQQVVIEDVLKRLTEGRNRVKQLVDSGDATVKVNKLDINALDVQIKLVRAKKSQADNGLLKALAAMREAMGLVHDYPLEIADADLPPAVYSIKVDDKDDKGNVKLKNGKPVQIDEYRRLYQINKESMITAALANRSEIVQANTANIITGLEIDAQGKIRGYQGNTFASGGDIHAKSIPQGVQNGEYRPGGFGIEMPAQLAGRRADRVARAAALHQRANAVVDKTTSLVALDTEAQFLKWQEAAEGVEDLSSVIAMALQLVKDVQALDPTQFTSGAVIQANITSVMVRTQLNDAKHMHALALAGLERATAGAFRIYPIPAAPAGLPK